jgi:hypothetical protein
VSTAAKAGAARGVHPATRPAALVLFVLALAGAHLWMLPLPLHWDELGHFVPAALDLYREGAWVPRSVPPNVHPPGLAAYLAGVWLVFGYSLAVTRAAMLALSALALWVAWLLARELCRGAADLATALLLVSPVFFAQAVMAHLDMGAMLFTSLALLWFLRERLAPAALACAALVMVKETGAVVPLVFACRLAWEGRRREAALFLLPLAPLAGWLLVLERETGHLFGNTGFAEYNVMYPLHPVRLAAAAARRLHYLFIADFHWVGTAALALAWRRGVFAGRGWHTAGALAAAHTAAVTLSGGAVLERYLLPILPVLYAAMAAAITGIQSRFRFAAAAVLAAGLAAGNFWNPPYPHPPENNLGWTDYVRVQQEAAAFVEARYGGQHAVATAWPLSAALVRPEAGYVATPLEVTGLPDFRPATLDAIDWEQTPVLVYFTELPESAPGFSRNETAIRLRRRYWRWEPDIAPAEFRARRPFLHSVGRWRRGGYLVEVYEKRGRKTAP